MAMDFVAGCVGGAAGLIVGHPLDTVKVRLQTQTPDNVKYRGTFDALFKIAKQESISGLYKGISSPLYGVSLVNALIFGVYGSLQPYVLGAPGNNSLWAHAAAGAVAGSVQSVICSPMELVKIRMQLNESSISSPWEVLKSIYRTEGGFRRGIFKGWALTVSREIPGFGSYFASYEALISHFEGYECLTSKVGQVGTVGMMMAGGSAGVISWLFCFPMDVIKTRFQSDVTGQYSGIFDCARKTYRAEGYRVFTRTLPSILIRAFPMNAVTFPVVTWIMRFSDQKQDDLQTGRQEIEKLLKEWDRTGIRTHETLYRFQIPTYRMLNQEHGGHTCFSVPGMGYFDTGRQFSTSACACLTRPEGEATFSSTVSVETSGPELTSHIPLPDTGVPAYSDEDRISSLVIRELEKGDHSPLEAAHVVGSGLEHGNETNATRNSNSFSAILKTWFLELSPTPVHRCNCLDECTCCNSK